METQQCAICDETIGTLRPDGQTEVLCALPCSHNFGSICIIRWLQLDSTNRDCPHCRRRMVYRQCGHLIMPCHASKAPPSVEEEDMPKNCSECGDEGDKRLLEVLRWRLKKLHDEKAVLMSIKKLVLPSLTRSLACSPAETIEERMERVEREFALDVEQVWREFEDKEGRSKW